MEPDLVLRKQLRALLDGQEAHMNVDSAVADFPMDRINDCAPNVPYSFWHLLEHIRIAQWDILEFSRNPSHISPPWPEGYWPPRDARADEAAWKQTIASIRSDMAALEELAANQSVKLYEAIPHGEGQTVLREVLLAADHTAYHVGEFAILRQVTGTWPPGHE
ncbi:MAG TPA: DinB family protein [Chloroflexota bacterium]|nr:DinB family protein [Chloroflexota bacterium]